MKKLILLLSFVICGQLVSAQTKTFGLDDILFEKGLALQELADEGFDLEEVIRSNNFRKELETNIKDQILEKALENYNKLIKNFPESKLLYRTLNNKALVELALEDEEEAKKTFIFILNSNANDTDKGGIGEGIMAEPYANYKNRAAKTLASIFIKENGFTEAIKYLDLTKKYPYAHFCGNEYAADNLYMAELYAKCYMGLNQPNKALDILLPNLMEDDNHEIVELTSKILLKSYKKSKLKELYKQAIFNYKVETIKDNNKEIKKYYFIFIDRKIEISAWQLESSELIDKTAVIKNIHLASEFYKFLN